MEDDLRRVGAVDGDRRVKRRLDRTAQHPCAQHGSDRFLLRLFRSRIVKGEGGKNVVLLGVRDLEGLAAQLAFRRLVRSGIRIGDGVASCIQLPVIHGPARSHGVAIGIAAAAADLIHRARVSVMRKVVAGDEPPAVAVAHVTSVVCKRAAGRRVKAGHKMEAFHPDRVFIVFKYAVQRIGIAAVIVLCADPPRDVVIPKSIVSPAHTQFPSTRDGDVVAGERTVARVGPAVAIERHVGCAAIRVVFRYLPGLLVFAVPDKVDIADAEGRRLRLDTADQRGTAPRAPELHRHIDIVLLDVRDQDLAAIGAAVRVRCRIFFSCPPQVDGDHVLAGLDSLNDFFQSLVDRFDCFALLHIQCMPCRNRAGDGAGGRHGLAVHRAAGLEAPFALVRARQRVDPLAGHPGGDGRIFCIVQCSGLFAFRSRGEVKFVDLRNDRLYLIRAQRGQIVRTVARAGLPPEADRELRPHVCAFQATHGARRQHAVFSVVVFADAHVAGPFPAVDRHRDGRELTDDGRRGRILPARLIPICTEGDSIVRAKVKDRRPGFVHVQRELLLIAFPEALVRLAGHAPAVLRQLPDREALRRLKSIREDRTGSRMRRHEIHADVLAAVILCRDRPAARERRGDRRTARPEPADILDRQIGEE